MDDGLAAPPEPGDYAGKRILAAMRHATRYADEIFRTMQGFMPAASRRVLDFGAGDGVFIERFSRLGQAVDCVEPDEEFAAALQGKAGRVVSDAAALAEGSYDFAFAVNVLEHVADPRGEAGKVRRALRPGGVFFVFTPAFNLLWTSLDGEVGHLRRYTRSTLAAELAGAGLSVARTEYFDVLGFPAALAVRALEAAGRFRYSAGTIGFYDRFIFPLSRPLDTVFSQIAGKSVLAVAVRAG